MNDNVLIIDRQVRVQPSGASSFSSAKLHILEKVERKIFAVEWKKLKVNSFEEAAEKYKKHAKNLDQVVRYIDSNTGESIKGPMYDKTEVGVNVYDVAKHLKPGIETIQKPIDPTQYEPRDRFQENKKMNKQTLKNLIRVTLNEVRLEKKSAQKNQLKESLRKIVSKVLTEVMSVPTPELNKEEKETIDKQYSKDGNQRLGLTRLQLEQELSKIVNEINKDFLVYWDDHNDLNVDAKALFRVRISQTCENLFDIEAMVNLDDRIRAIALNWDQVKAFVKANFKDVEDTKVDSAKAKAMGHLKDQSDKGDLPQHDKPKRKEVGDTKNDEKDYNKKDVEEDDDQPNQPMKSVEVDKLKRLRDFTDKDNKVKPPKHKNDKKLIVKDKKTPKFKA